MCSSASLFGVEMAGRGFYNAVSIQEMKLMWEGGGTRDRSRNAHVDCERRGYKDAQFRYLEGEIKEELHHLALGYTCCVRVAVSWFLLPAMDMAHGPFRC